MTLTSKGSSCSKPAGQSVDEPLQPASAMREEEGGLHQLELEEHGIILLQPSRGG